MGFGRVLDGSFFFAIRVEGAICATRNSLNGESARRFITSAFPLKIRHHAYSLSRANTSRSIMEARARPLIRGLRVNSPFLYRDMVLLTI